MKFMLRVHAPELPSNNSTHIPLYIAPSASIRQPDRQYPVCPPSTALRDVSAAMISYDPPTFAYSAGSLAMSEWPAGTPVDCR
jgi:hypothetical protein